MKTTILQFALFLFMAATAVAQAPQAFNYQGVARGTGGAPLATQPIGLKLTVHDGSATGTVVYAETFPVTTNAYGLYNVAVGNGTVVSGTFAGINWATGNKYLEVAIDPTGGTTYASVGTAQLLSVPYAMYAANAPASGVTSVAAGTGLSGGTITGTGTISMPAVGTAGTYGSATQVPVFTTDAEGRVTGVTNTTIAAGGVGTVTSVTAGTGLSGGIITGAGTISMPNVGTAGTYGSATNVPVITTDAQGRVSGITNTAISAVTSVTAGTGLSGGTITGTGTISMPNVGTAGTYGSATNVPVITTDAQGRVTSVTNTAVSVPTVAGTTNYVAKFTGSSAIGNSLLFDNGAQVGVNTITPSNMAKLHVSGVGTYSVLPVYQAGIIADGGASSANASGVYAEGGWRGVYGRNPGTATGTEAIGVLGRVEGSSYTGTGYGVKGENAGTGGSNNYGVYGTATNAGNGVAGVITGSGTGAAGIFDGGTSGHGIIVKNGNSGFNTLTPSVMSKVHISGVGTYSVAPYYQAGLVVDGGASAASASGIYSEGGWKGVYGRNPGTATGTQAIGVHGRCEGSAYTLAGYGVLAEAVGTGPTNYGVYASASGAGTNWAGYFSGNVHITGSISKGSGTFMIDHPLDPENKYLYHSFVESPDMMNIYNGNVVTDASGDATITLPGYFEALNKDFRYQLTVVGTFAQAIVAQKVAGNQFKIKTDKPNVEVSWQVTGIRQDNYANAHRVVPEVEKEALNKGYYLHPSEWGQPAAKGIDALANPASVAENGNRPAAQK